MSNTSPDSPRDAHADASEDADATRAYGASRAPLILCVDTATDVRSVAIARGAELIAKVREPMERGRSSALLADIDEALHEADVTLAEIDLYAVAKGPGSFTGLRAGLATTKAFANAQRRPIAAVPTLAAVALSAGESAHTVALIPAGRGEVFAQTFSVGGDARVEALDAPAHVSPASLVARIVERVGAVRWAGGGAHTHSALIRETAECAGIEVIESVADDHDAGANDLEKKSDDLNNGEGGDDQRRERVWTLARAAKDYAAEIARLGLISFRKGETVRAEELRAEYVRLSDAELNERCRR
jgi:tRNA threonylcarbamoyladenosine biosynthesis protein TsaB